MHIYLDLRVSRRSHGEGEIRINGLRLWQRRDQWQCHGPACQTHWVDCNCTSGYLHLILQEADLPLEMPRDLPGFYFDDEKQRYFPISSKPASKPVSVKADPPKPHSNNPSKPSSFSRQNLKRKRGSISSNNIDNMRRSINPAQNQRFMQFV